MEIPEAKIQQIISQLEGESKKFPSTVLYRLGDDLARALGTRLIYSDALYAFADLVLSFTLAQEAAAEKKEEPK
jgi:hypothetical protein